jgi:very-short-patch-repair endonuclease
MSLTSLPRTLIDLAARLPMDDLALVCHQAEVRYKVRPAQVDAALTRLYRPPGVAKLRAIIHGDHPLTLSRMERGFVALLRAERFPLPKTNVHIDRGYVDCRWPEHHLTVELDSYRFHHSRHAWEQDRERERAARARGDEFRRYTYADVVEDPVAMLADLARLLGFPAKLQPRGQNPPGSTLDHART